VVGTEFAWFVLVAIFVSSATVRRRFDAVSLWVERATGAFLIALGVRLAFSRASA
jgi:threonine/homoserine/homoserine lactone efflux protein